MNDLLQKQLADIEDSRLKQAISYSLFAGGKRIRPNLLYLTLEGYGKERSIGDYFACALEMIHTASLIHDDLPAMDDDDYRRGHLTCHKKFGEDVAILAGDTLFVEAFKSINNANVDSDKIVACAKVLGEMAGANGMMQGQDLDLLAENTLPTYEMLKKTHNKKTGCLFASCFMIGAILSDHQNTIDKWKEIGLTIGLAFQVQDDLLDVQLTTKELGKSTSDITNNKLSSVSLLGIEKAEILMNKLYDEGIQSIKDISDFDSILMIEELEKIRNRRK